VNTWSGRPDNVDTVIVDGRLFKREGELIESHWPTRFKASCDRIIDGYRMTDPKDAIRTSEERHSNLNFA
jgi:hypothetical protein